MTDPAAHSSRFGPKHHSRIACITSSTLTHIGFADVRESVEEVMQAIQNDVSDQIASCGQLGPSSLQHPYFGGELLPLMELYRSLDAILEGGLAYWTAPYSGAGGVAFEEFVTSAATAPRGLAAATGVSFFSCFLAETPTGLSSAWTGLGVN